jgi:hypothetical protein
MKITCAVFCVIDTIMLAIIYITEPKNMIQSMIFFGFWAIMFFLQYLAYELRDLKND